MEFLASLSLAHWAALAAAAVLVGLTKAGLNGGTLIAVPLLASLFGARASTGILLGIMMCADVPAVWNYRRDISPPHLARTLPAALAGILLGVLVGGVIPETVFRRTMAGLILLSAALLTLRELRGRATVLPQHPLVTVPMGLLAGFASMVGNVAGSLMGLYFISSGLSKGSIIGTSVWFFFLVNLAKLPFHLFVWRTATLGTLLADLLVLPVTVAATLFGIRLVRLIPEKPYRLFLIAASAVGGIYLLAR